MSEESREEMDTEKPAGNTKHLIYITMTDKPRIVTVINRAMAMVSVTLNTIAETRKLLNKNTQIIVDHQMIGTKINTFQLEMKKPDPQH